MRTVMSGVVTAPQPPMTTTVDAVYAPDLSTRSARPCSSVDWQPTFPPRSTY
ncbi:MAG TPA: hypothetical protein VLM19_04915 [Nitrospiraceae bacterium]|nr:hypothetical protein [Nitrospiraceae bacterium]